LALRDYAASGTALKQLFLVQAVRV